MITSFLAAAFDGFQFAGIIHWLLVAVIFLFAAIASVWLYRKHNLTKPYTWILPTLRVLGLGMLLMMLLQPVLQRTSTKTVRGQIPVIVDTSGSMSTIDTYEPHRQVEIGWALDFYPRELRSTVFKDEADSVADLHERLLTAERKAGEMRSAIDGGKPVDPKAAAALGSDLKKAAKRVEKLRGTFEDSVEKHAYLSDAERASGGITWLRFNNIKGADIASLNRADHFPDRPDETGTWPKLESKANIGEDYGLMLHGYLLPPKTGGYTIRKTSDDESEIWLSPNANPGGAKRILKPNQGETKVELVQDKPRYIKVLLKEGYGGDFVKVGWRHPDNREENPIPGQYLAPMGENDADFARVWPGFTAALSGTAERLEGLGELLGKIEAGQGKECTQALDRFNREMEQWRELQERPDELQEAADTALANSGTEEVDAAIERLETMRRSDLAQVMLRDKPLKLIDTLDDKGDVSLFSFAEDAEAVGLAAATNFVAETLPVTRIASIAARTLNRFEKMPIGGVVVVTDGNNNAGKPLLELRESLKERDIPLFALGVGAEQPPPDVSVARVSAPRTSFLDDTLNVSVALHRHGHIDTPVKVKIVAGEDVLAEETVAPGGEAETVVDLSFLEEEAGERVYQVIAEREDRKADELYKKKIEQGEHAGPPIEAFDDNNEKTLQVTILEDRIKTLCLDEFPRWESRYANMMLKRDKRVDLDTIFVASTKDGKLPVAEASEEQQKDKYPASRDGLFAYHIVILGDVDPEHFTTEQLEDLRDFVLERGGTLIAMAGPHHMPSAYAGTPLADVLPLNRFGRSGQTNRLAFADHPLAFKQGAYQPGIESEALYEDVLQIGRNPDNTRELWDGLPRLSWLKEDVIESRSSDPMVQAKAMKGDTATGSAPVAIKSYAGLGKTLYLGSDSFWRWRYRARWTYHHRFWGQVLLWSTMGRTTGADPNIKLMADRPVYAPEEPVVIKARLFDEKELPLSNAEAEIEVYRMGGGSTNDTEVSEFEAGALVKRLPLFHLENSGGEYRAEIRDLEKGVYRIVPKVNELDHLYAGGEGAQEPVEIMVNVRDLPTSEYVDLGLDKATLESLTPNVLPFDQALDMLDDIEAIKNTETIHDPIELWSRWWWLVALALILCLEWLLRKRCKLA